MSEYEKDQINGLHQGGKGLREIARAIKRSPGVISRYLGNLEAYGTLHQNAGRPPKLLKRDKRAIFLTAASAHREDKTIYALDIKKELQLDVSKQTIICVLNNSKVFEAQNLKKAPKLKSEHIEARKIWARNNMGTDWNRVSFV